ncbi:peptidase inhibitor family I36 protein [Catellatospora citrea]|nr:peptidase inhibitor family I36 protein [Catellatospora citrea]RKE10621.1 hypothetical protein C8E86_5537 [Catellatospora citrea]
MERRFLLKGAAAMAVAGALTLIPSAAQAAPLRCQPGYVCIRENLNLRKSVTVLPNGSASSVINLTDETVWFHEHGDYNRTTSGRAHGVSPGRRANCGEFEGLQLPSVLVGCLTSGFPLLARKFLSSRPAYLGA